MTGDQSVIIRSFSYTCYHDLSSRTPDTEVIEAIPTNFPINVQRAVLGTQLHSIGEALDPLRRVELMKKDDAYDRQTNSTPAQNQNRKRHGPSEPTYDRNRGQN
jgi:hypothetical protein